MTRNFFNACARLFVGVCMATVLPATVGAQTLVVTPTTITASASAGSSPTPQTVRVSNGAKGALKWTVVQTTPNWVSVSPTTGVNSGTLDADVFNRRTRGWVVSDFVSSPGQGDFAGRRQYHADHHPVLPPPPPPPTLVVTCPANMSVASPDGQPVIVTYSATTTGGSGRSR